MRPTPLALTALAGLAVLAGCGEDDESADTTVAATNAAPTPATGTVDAVTTSSSPEPAPVTTPPELTATSLTPASSVPPPLPPGTADPAAAQLPEVQAAVADLAAMIDVDPGAVTVVEVREVTWRDGSLGCPEPGLAATQALVNGQLVVLESGGVRYEYHSGPQRPLFYCAKPDPPLED